MRYDNCYGNFYGGWSRSGSSWWREVAKIHYGIGVDGGGWFEESLVRRVGNGANTFFWTDMWLG